MPAVKTVPKNRSPYPANDVGGFRFTVGAEVADTINLTIQATDPNGKALVAKKCLLLVYLSTSSAGSGITATAPDGGVTASVGDVIVALTTAKAFLVATDANGRAILQIIHSGALTLYAAALKGDGEISVSGAITFA